VSDTDSERAAVADTIAAETFESVSGHLSAAGSTLECTAPFVLPGWMQAWRQVFAPRASLWIRSFQQDGELIGIAPLRVENRAAWLIGDAEVCDHLDLICAVDRRKDFCETLLDHLKADGIDLLELNPLRPDSVAMSALVAVARKKGYPVSIAEEDLLFELELPASWDDYLLILSGKQRHEVRRKLRRLEKSVAAEFRLLDDPTAVQSAMDDFLVLFRQNREDKAAFMDNRMEAYFRLLAKNVPEMRIGFLHVDAIPAAAVCCLDFRGTRYLYNSGYDANLGHLSVGILCKILSIRDGIARGLKRYDFLKGDETYKRQLGGNPVPIYRCRIDLSGA
jgi:CelD/BcsL family acetyltransferase involved in cellulose biosynthesis